MATLSDITEAVCRAVHTAGALVNNGGRSTLFDGVPENSKSSRLLITFMKSLDRDLVASNTLAKKDPFVAMYSRPVRSIAKVSGASYHSAGRNLAQQVFMAVCEAADLLTSNQVITGKKRRFDFGLVGENWPQVKAYLRDEAPRFDAGRAIALIQDEATRRSRLRTKSATQTSNKSPSQRAKPKGSGGAPIKYPELYNLFGERPAATDEEIHTEYHAKYKRKGLKHLGRITLEKVREVRKNLAKAERRKQNHKSVRG